MKYILIACKPSSADYCRGCLMERYNDQYMLFTECTRDELIKEWAQLAAIERGCNELGYEFQVIIDGYFAGGDSYPDRGSAIASEEEDEIINTLSEEYDLLKKEAKEKSNNIIAERKKAFEESVLQEKKNRERREAAAEFRQFEILKAKFEK